MKDLHSGVGNILVRRYLIDAAHCRDAYNPIAVEMPPGVPKLTNIENIAETAMAMMPTRVSDVNGRYRQRLQAPGVRRVRPRLGA